jgi:hypothetical protein
LFLALSVRLTRTGKPSPKNTGSPTGPCSRKITTSCTGYPVVKEVAETVTDGLKKSELFKEGGWGERPVAVEAG